MKQFIVLAAILPIVMVLIAQFTLEAARSLRMQEAESAVRAFCIEASYYDGGGAAEAEALKNRLASIFRAEANEVYIELSPRPGGSHIDWKISYPVGEIMAGGRFMGLKPEKNRGRAKLEGTIVIAPKPREEEQPGPQEEEPTGPQAPEPPEPQESD